MLIKGVKLTQKTLVIPTAIVATLVGTAVWAGGKWAYEDRHATLARVADLEVATRARQFQSDLRYQELTLKLEAQSDHLTDIKKYQERMDQKLDHLIELVR